MRRARRGLWWAGFGVGTALLFLAAGQLSSAIFPVLVLRTQAIGLGDYHGTAMDPAPRANPVVHDIDRDPLGPGHTACGRPPVPGAAQPAAPAPVPTSASTPAPGRSITGAVANSQPGAGIANALVSLSPAGRSTVTSPNGAFGLPSVPA